MKLPFHIGDRVEILRSMTGVVTGILENSTYEVAVDMSYGPLPRVYHISWLDHVIVNNEVTIEEES